jgi:hypothetical protein
MPGVRRAVARANRAEPSRLAVAGRCPLEHDRGALLAHSHGRLKHAQDLGDALERERLDAGGEGAEACDQGGAARGDGGEYVVNGSDMRRV